MTFAELLTEVYGLTTRPDLIDLTKSAIKSATLKAHQTDFYSKDIYEKSFLLAGGLEYIKSLDYVSVIPNYRALKYMRLIDPTTSEPIQFITVLTPEEILDKWGRDKTDICYVAGRILEIKASIEFETVLMGSYVNPIVTEINYSSWVADLYPYAIIHEAARVVFGTIGQQAEANTQRVFVLEQYAELRINALPDVGS